MKIKSLTSLLVLFIVLSFHSVFAQEAAPNAQGSLFYQANAYYREGKYNVAIKDYKKLIDSGLESGNLYYNLGNSYFKQGQLGLALLNYERAKFFIPQDSDLRSNFEYTLHTLNLEPQSFGSRAQRLVYKLFEAMTLDFLTVFLSIVYVILILFFILNLFSSGIKKVFGVAVSILLTLFILSAVALDGRINYLNKSAIVVSKEADVKFEPFAGATTYFKLNEGSRVEVTDKAESWYKLKRFDGKTGWVDKGALVLISGNPR
ncbi:MAG: tetratricopeptide repeat protein [Candidatus Omnitrophota bacterium]